MDEEHITSPQRKAEDNTCSLSSAPAVTHSDPARHEESPARKRMRTIEMPHPPVGNEHNREEASHLLRGIDSDGISFVKLAQSVVTDIAHKHIWNGEVGDWQKNDEDFIRHFTDPRSENQFDILRRRNPMPRDSRIIFFSETHKYLIDDSVFVPRSVTEMIHQYEEKFIAYIAILKMRGGKNWEIKQKEYTHPNGAIMTDDEIKNVWDWRRRVSSYRGVLLHWHIEMLLNGAIIHGPFSTEFNYYIDINTQVMISHNTLILMFISSSIENEQRH